MAKLETLCEELNKRGIICSVVKDDDYKWDELSFEGMEFERKSGNKPVEPNKNITVVSAVEYEIGNYYGISSPFVRTDINSINENETDIAANVSDVFDRHAFNSGLKIKAPDTTL